MKSGSGIGTGTEKRKRLIEVDEVEALVVVNGEVHAIPNAPIVDFVTKNIVTLPTVPIDPLVAPDESEHLSM